MVWEFADAENRLDEVIDRALTEGPQRIRRRQDTVIVVSAAEFERLTGRRLPSKNTCCVASSWMSSTSRETPAPGETSSCNGKARLRADRCPAGLELSEACHRSSRVSEFIS